MRGDRARLVLGGVSGAARRCCGCNLAKEGAAERRVIGDWMGRNSINQREIRREKERREVGAIEFEFFI